MPEGVVMPSNFEIAALDAVKTPTIEERTAEIKINGKYVSLWRRPTPGQYAMFQLRLSRSEGSEQARGIDRFFTNLLLEPEEIAAGGRLDDDGVTYEKRFEGDSEEPVGLDWFIGLIEDGVIEQNFLLDLLKEALEIHSGFPTSPEPASSSSPTASGPRSTARSRRQGSTPSS